MKLQTFKEKIWKEYNRNRRLSGTHQIIIGDLDDVRNVMLGKLVFLKVNIDEITNVFRLKTLYVVQKVYMNSNGYVTLDLTNIRDDTVKTSHIHGVTLVTNRILEYPWFVKSVKKHFNLHGIKELTKWNLLSILNVSGIHMTLHNSTKANLIMVAIGSKFISSLITKDTNITCFHNYVIINGVSNDENYGLLNGSPYRVISLLRDTYNLENFVRRYYNQVNPFDTIDVDDIYNYMEYKLSYLL